MREGHLVLKSDNSEYKPYKVVPGNIMEIWKALGFISFKLPEAFENESQTNNMEELIKEIKNDVSEIRKKL